MNKFWIAATLAAGLALGSLASVQAKLPPAPAKSDAEKAAEAEKAAAAKAKDAADLERYTEKAVANYRKNKGIADPKAPAAKPATTSGKK